MAQTQMPAFGQLLRQYRISAGLTQDALAEKARLSIRAISDLERGARRSPHRDTALLLADALDLTTEDRELFLRTAARPPRATASSPSAATSSADSASEPTLPESALPTPLTPIIGREHEEAAAAHLLGREDVRLLTLVGPPGIGKTRLGLQVASTLRAQFADGVCFAPLAAAREPDLVFAALARALALRPVGSAPLFEQVRVHLREKHLLLLLDNFEQALAAAPQIAELLASCATIKALVTSRAPLHVRGEHTLAVPPLALPDPGRLPSPAELGRYGAIALFVQRARAIRPTFALTATNAPVVAAICRRLDGIPLAIELAAARVRLLPLPTLLELLEHRLTLLTGGASDLPERQQTLRGAIAWSYELLDEAVQRLFRRLAVFSGGCALEAAEAVCAMDIELEIETARSPSSLGFLDAVESLVDQSLLVEEELSEREVRFRMLETIREYAWELLAGHGEVAAASRRHAEYYLTLAESAEPHLKGPEQGAWLLRLEREHDNARAALAWACEAGETELGLRLASALWWLWQLHGHLREGRDWFERLLEQDGAGAEPSALRTKALDAAGNLTFKQGDYERARTLLGESLALYRQQEQRAGVADALNVLGLIAEEQGDYRSAVTLFEESLELRRALGATRGVGATLNNLAIVAYHQGEYACAVALYEEAVPLFRTLGDHWATAIALNNLAEAVHCLRQHERAASLFAESLALFGELGDKRGMGMALNNLGCMAGEQANYAQAIGFFLEALDLHRSVGYRLGIIEVVEELAHIFSRQGQWERAARLYGMAEAQREDLGAPMPLAERETHDQRRAAVQVALGAELFARAYAAGRPLSAEQIVTELRA